MYFLCLVASRENYYDPFGSSDDDEELLKCAAQQQRRRAWITDPGDSVSSMVSVLREIFSCVFQCVSFWGHSSVKGFYWLGFLKVKA